MRITRLLFLLVPLFILAGCTKQSAPVVEVFDKDAVLKVTLDNELVNQILFDEGIEIWSSALIFQQKEGREGLLKGSDFVNVLDRAGCYNDEAFGYGLCYKKDTTIANSNVTGLVDEGSYFSYYRRLLEEDPDLELYAKVGNTTLEIFMKGEYSFSKCFKVVKGSTYSVNNTSLENLAYSDGGCDATG